VERTTIAGETEVLGENLPQRHFVLPQIPHDQVRFRTPDRSGGKPATTRLSYGAALYECYSKLYLLGLDSFSVSSRLRVELSIAAIQNHEGTNAQEEAREGLINKIFFLGESSIN
jgi:hypothetical protein